MRIIAGSARGRSLKLPQGEVRPTADRVKESLFNVLGQWLDGEVVLDLFAGAGSLGLEALSRGASHATFVERDRRVIQVLEQNVRALGFNDVSSVVSLPAERAVPRLAADGKRFSLVFADPPYALHALSSLLQALDETRLVSPGGRIVLEHDKREVLPEAVGTLQRVDERRFGDSVVTFYERRSETAESQAE